MDDEAFMMTYPPPPLHHHHPDAYHIPKYHKQPEPDPPTARVQSEGPAMETERYEWIGKENTRLYMESIKKW
jgi:hypothetical protein